MESKLMSIRQTGEYLGYAGKTAGRSSIFGHLQNKRLVKVKIQGRTFITKESADALILKNIV
jgi:hypothetical protein|tara:strand:+ start:5146 stop:5331 length:186 start_codon:yes stop_codon:yes gene_type:complete